MFASRAGTAGEVGLVEPDDGSTDDDPTWLTVRFDGQPVIRTPGGRYFCGSVEPVLMLPALDDGEIVARLPKSPAVQPFLRRSGRGFVVAEVSGADRVRHYGLNRRRARARVAAGPDGAALPIPRAYEIDDFTFGLLWATGNLDDALLEDDAELADSVSWLDPYHGRLRSAVGHVGNLSGVSQLWLGSAFCVRHVLRNVDRMGATTMYWSRTQCGEEASAWVLFEHRFRYLRELSESSAAGAGLGFCLPAGEVTALPVAERVVLMLALALAESFGFQVQVCPEPEYSDIHAFVLGPDSPAIIANWIRADGIWHVDVTDTLSVLRELTDAGEYTGAHSIIAGADAYRRLRALAEYLDLDWTWLARRCGELADHGAAGLVQPRSRLLSLAGLERACGYLSNLERVAR